MQTAILYERDIVALLRRDGEEQRSRWTVDGFGRVRRLWRWTRFLLDDHYNATLNVLHRLAAVILRVVGARGKML